MKVGERFRSQGTTAQVIVMKGTDKDIQLSCAGAAMVGLGSPAEAAGAPPVETGEPLIVGKRYIDDESGVEVLCTAAGGGPLQIDGRTLVTAVAKLLPSSD
ncbi:hypothetical protein GCM10010472_01960 [Pseudonocardia halophobica]|uniref:Uncharacterized protein n=1 Tax=Pseudonocardia halophobica TaxID=29401 RepID=A0A9W6L1N6_9PSEU|nr:hypothetical protein [Pseudonocardia halophobica]GLL10536.1 hypothetical protein GCM10017577_16760 [Pseudonocardia halophobica]